MRKLKKYKPTKFKAKDSYDYNTIQKRVNEILSYQTIEQYPNKIPIKEFFLLDGDFFVQLDEKLIIFLREDI
ncbi:hypothetical protein [Ruminococcus bromii]|uniref:hypothetical protein n=1 Tax=Ruminococcus bromii TaxID=40518 RepID=UPI003AB3A320